MDNPAAIGLVPLQKNNQVLKSFIITFPIRDMALISSRQQEWFAFSSARMLMTSQFRVRGGAVWIDESSSLLCMHARMQQTCRATTVKSRLRAAILLHTFPDAQGVIFENVVDAEAAQIYVASKGVFSEWKEKELLRYRHELF